jgi:hypothetical protein
LDDNSNVCTKILSYRTKNLKNLSSPKGLKGCQYHMTETDMGQFFVTRPDPTRPEHGWTRPDPTRAWLDPTRPEAENFLLTRPELNYSF